MPNCQLLHWGSRPLERAMTRNSGSLELCEPPTLDLRVTVVTHCPLLQLPCVLGSTGSAPKGSLMPELPLPWPQRLCFFPQDIGQRARQGHPQWCQSVCLQPFLLSSLGPSSGHLPGADHWPRPGCSPGSLPLKHLVCPHWPRDAGPPVSTLQGEQSVLVCLVIFLKVE